MLTLTLAQKSEKVYAIQEVTTIFPGLINDFYKKSDVMHDYFSRVILSERKVFGPVDFMPSNVIQMALKMGDLNNVDLKNFGEALNSDVFVVFGSSYIKGELVDFLVSKGCFNIHMGASPYYRGTATNFWPLYDDKPEFVGATIHLLTKGLDSGPILFHALPRDEAICPFDLGMKAVKVAHEGLANRIESGEIFKLEPLKQDRSKEIKYTRKADFNDEIASHYLINLPKSDKIGEKLSKRNLDLFYKPLVL